jgi:uncharacterized protein (DUF488 family)
MPNSVLTIGHSNQTLEEFKSLLRQHSVTAVADIRTKPYSAYAQWFNQEIIKSELEQSGITYVYLGTELGNQPTDATCYKNGKVSYELMAQTVLFKKGLQRIIEGSKKFSLAIMCVEKEPLECHRSVLHTRELQALGCSVSHILEDGRLETHEETMSRLLKQFGFGEGDLFRTREQLIEEACARQEQKVAYKT